MKAVQTIVCVLVVAVLGACQDPSSQSKSGETGKSSCVEKMKAGIACGSPATNGLPPACTDSSGMSAPCPEELNLPPNIDDCIIEYRLCANWCNVNFCQFIGPACYVCRAQCYNEYNLCKLNQI